MQTVTQTVSVSEISENPIINAAAIAFGAAFATLELVRKASTFEDYNDDPAVEAAYNVYAVAYDYYRSLNQ